MVLEQFPEVLDDELGRTRLAVLHEPLVDADDVHEFVGQVVFGTLAVVERDGGTSGHGRHRENRQNHPLGPGALGVDAERLDVLVRDVLEPVADVAGHQLVHVLLGQVEVQRLLDGLPVVLAGPELPGHDLVDARDVDAGLLGELLGSHRFALLVAVLALALHRGGDLLGVLRSEDLLDLVVGRGLLVVDVVLDLATVGTPVLLAGLSDGGLGDVREVVAQLAGPRQLALVLLFLLVGEQEARAVPTGTAQEPSDELRESDVDDRRGEFDVAEVAVTRPRVLAAGLALQTGVDDAQSRVHQPHVDGEAVVVVGVGGDDLGRRHFSVLLGVHQPEADLADLLGCLSC